MEVYIVPRAEQQFSCFSEVDKGRKAFRHLTKRFPAASSVSGPGRQVRENLYNGNNSNVARHGAACGGERAARQTVSGPSPP